MLFKFKKNASKKEFIQYKDGKIVSIELEQPKKPQRIELHEEIPLYQELSEEKPKEKLLEKIKKKIKPQYLKMIIAVVVFIFFVFTLLDIYKAFFLENSDEVIPQEDVQSPPKQVTTAPPLSSDGISLEEDSKINTPIKQPTTNTEPTSTEEPSHPNEPASSTASPSTPLQTALETANVVNTLIVSQAMSEIRYMNNYAEKKATLIGLRSHLKKTLSEKQEMYVYLTLNEPIFLQSSTKELYETTKERLLQSITFTKVAQGYLNEVREKEVIRQHALQYIAVDGDLQKKQIKALTHILQENNIPYQFNEATNTIQYSL